MICRYVVDITVFYADGEAGDFTEAVAARTSAEAETEAVGRIARQARVDVADVYVNRTTEEAS